MDIRYHFASLLKRHAFNHTSQFCKIVLSDRVAATVYTYI